MRSWILIAVALAACSKEKGATSRDGVVEAWKKGGLETSALTAAKTEVGSDCASGTVSKLDVLVCTFKSDKDAKDAEERGLAWVGDNTGASRAQGEMLIVVADRKKTDPQGKVINQVITLPAK
jgi:hypothetical protein